MLAEMVERGILSDLKALKAEFRRQSFRLHPDVSHASSEDFVRMKNDFERARTILEAKLSRPGFDRIRLATSLRTAFARGLPSTKRTASPADFDLIVAIVQEGALHSAQLAQSLRRFFEESSEASQSLRAALVNYSDALVNVGHLRLGVARLIASYLKESKDPSHEPLSQWLAEELPTRR